MWLPLTKTEPLFFPSSFIFKTMNLLNWETCTSNLFYSSVILEMMPQWRKTTTVCNVNDDWNTERQISLYAAMEFDSFDTQYLWFTQKKDGIFTKINRVKLSTEDLSRHYIEENILQDFVTHVHRVLSHRDRLIFYSKHGQRLAVLYLNVHILGEPQLNELLYCLMNVNVECDFRRKSD